ncbi:MULTISPECIES: hypothetical protein [Nocardia]|uniref:hypothetical protein n=1 Tax=Nocardia TaxID=1817 RepID=UPI0018944C53|nr:MULTISPECIES: hypothetical protein [Nocardia]MBF6352051.1 hypothetical protein [Nocardia flavorosea]
MVISQSATAWERLRAAIAQAILRLPRDHRHLAALDSSYNYLRQFTPHGAVDSGVRQRDRLKDAPAEAVLLYGASVTELPRAAYIPFQPEYGYNRAVELAIPFLDRVDARGTIVVVPQKNTLTFCAPLNTYAKGRPVLTPKNSNQSGIGYGRPALVYAPGQRELALATEFARNAPIAVVEDAGFSSSRWADETGQST